MEILLYGFPAVAIVIGLTQVAKRFISDRYIPLVAILLGVTLVSVVVIPYWTTEALIKGLVVGLTASGLYSGAKTTLK
jgi:hypothetical protein